jgi:hypothetical protein
MENPDRAEIEQKLMTQKRLFFFVSTSSTASSRNNATATKYNEEK